MTNSEQEQEEFAEYLQALSGLVIHDYPDIAKVLLVLAGTLYLGQNYTEELANLVVAHAEETLMRLKREKLH